MEILLFPAVLLLFLSDPQLIRCVSVSEKHFVWPTGSDWLVERTLVFVLLPWALLPESKVSVCVCVCVFASLTVDSEADGSSEVGVHVIEVRGGALVHTRLRALDRLEDQQAVLTADHFPLWDRRPQD